MRSIPLLTAALSTQLFSVAVYADSENWYIEKHLMSSVSSRFAGSNKLTTQVNSAGLKAEYQGDTLSFNFDGYWQYDAVYDFHSGFSEAAKNKYQDRLWLNDAYISWNWADYDISLGYQKVVWGQADDLRVVDVVNPLDLKDFVLFDIDDYRISLPMLRIENSIAEWDLESMWIIDSKPNQIPPAGSEFEISSLPDLPSSETDDSEFGLRAQSFLFSTDVAFYAYHGYNDSPVITVTNTDTRFQYHKETLLGMSLSRPIGDWVIRNELAWFLHREFTTLDVSAENSDVLQWLVGVDYLYKDWLLSAQATDRSINQWTDNYAVEKNDPLYTLSADATLASGKVGFRLAASHSDSAGGGQLYQTKLSYRPNKHWEWKANLDVLSGHSSNFFGQFKNRDRIWLSADYIF